MGSNICYGNTKFNDHRTYQHCLDNKKKYRYLGHYCSLINYEKLKEYIDFAVEDFENHGFKVHTETDKTKYYMYADLRDYERSHKHSSGSMAVVSLGRYLTSVKSRMFYIQYKVLRDYGFTLCETIYLLSQINFNVIKIAYNGVYIPRDKPEIKASNRQGKNGVFYSKHNTSLSLMKLGAKKYREHKQYRNDVLDRIPSYWHPKNYNSKSYDKIKNTSKKELYNLKRKLNTYIKKWS